MHKEIFFDHTFTEDQNHKLLKRMERFGFTLDPQKVEHPGKAHCRFIKIGGKYLEFVHIGKGGVEMKKPGLSFGAKNLLGYKQKLDRKKLVQIDYLHKNYNWKENSTDNLPGWNFLSFKKTGVQTIYPWFTEYEQHPARNKKSRKVSPKHKNKVEKIHGAEIDLNAKGEELFSLIIGKKLKDKVELPDGFMLYFNCGKRTSRYKNVILQSSSLASTQKFMSKEKLTTFGTQEAICIKNPHLNSRMWDILIIE